MATITYAQIKAALQADSYPTAPGSSWQGTDAGSYTTLFGPSACYNAGVPYDARTANYGIAYPGVMPAAISNAIQQQSYTATLNGTPTSGQAPLAVAFTLTESNGNGTSFAWDFGDGNTSTTTTPTANHTYSTAGSYTAKCTPTVDGAQKGPYSAPAITVTAAYSSTLAASPLTATHASTVVTFTLTEQNKPVGATSSYLWDFGDGSTKTTTASPTTTYTYPNTGSFTAKCTPTINSQQEPIATASAPVVVS